MSETLIFKACRHLLRPVVRLLLRHGLTYPAFAEIGKDVYVDVARADYGIQGRPTNNSRVAMLTGLSRREVARVRDRILESDEGTDNRHGNRISKVLTAWHVDPEFTDAAGNPAELPPDGKVGSFASLLGKYAGDMPHGAVQKEMLQKHLIEKRPDGKLRVLAREYTYSTADPEILRQMSVALHDHATTLEHNLNDERRGPKRFEAMADNNRISRRAAERFMQLVETRGMNFLNEMDTWLSEQENNATSDSGRNVRLGVGVYLICEELDERQGK